MLRLTSLLWRLRRATAIDTGLLETTAELHTASDLNSVASANDRAAECIAQQIGSLEDQNSLEDSGHKDQNETLDSEIARRFLQLDPKSFERLGRYETALWRQVYQAIFVLDAPTTTKHRPTLAFAITIKHAFSSIRVAVAKDLKFNRSPAGHLKLSEIHVLPLRRDKRGW